MYTNPALPTVANNPEETRPVLESYEKANEKNRIAIQNAQRHNKKLQQVYNKKSAPKKEEGLFSKLFVWPKF